MNILQSIILGIVEGLSEFLPISSTAHLVATTALLKIEGTEFVKSFLISIQLGAILSVAVLYFKKIIKQPKLILKIIAAFIPTAIIGLLAYQFIKDILLENLLVIAFALIAGGLVMIILEKDFAEKERKKHIAKLLEDKKNKIDEVVESEENEDEINISYKKAVLIGVSQALAVIPGVSRSAATIMGGLSLKIKRKEIVEFSFLLALPTMLAATLLDIYKSPPTLNQNEIVVWLVGFLVSFITAIIAIKFFLKFIKNNNFIPFGWYRIVIGLIILISLALR